MKWNEFKEDIDLNPDDRLWEYDGDGQRIYKEKCGFTGKTLWDGGYALWQLKYGHDWIPEEDVIFENNK